jgi:hypothetical protein
MTRSEATFLVKDKRLAIGSAGIVLKDDKMNYAKCWPVENHWCYGRYLDSSDLTKGKEAHRTLNREYFTILLCIHSQYNLLRGCIRRQILFT